jgi:hypothetical protein
LGGPCCLSQTVSYRSAADNRDPQCLALASEAAIIKTDCRHFPVIVLEVHHFRCGAKAKGDDDVSLDPEAYFGRRSDGLVQLLVP